MCPSHTYLRRRLIEIPSFRIIAKCRYSDTIQLLPTCYNTGSGISTDGSNGFFFKCFYLAI